MSIIKKIQQLIEYSLKATQRLIEYIMAALILIFAHNTDKYPAPEIQIFAGEIADQVEPFAT